MTGTPSSAGIVGTSDTIVEEAGAETAETRATAETKEVAAGLEGFQKIWRAAVAATAKAPAMRPINGSNPNGGGNDHTISLVGRADDRSAATKAAHEAMDHSRQ